MGPKYLVDEYAVLDTRYWVEKDNGIMWISYIELFAMVPLSYLWYIYIPLITTAVQLTFCVCVCVAGTGVQLGAIGQGISGPFSAAHFSRWGPSCTMEQN